MMEFPQMDPIVARPEDEPGFEREIWQPRWNCFCCQDTGIVRSHLVKLVMKDFDWNIHKLPVCRNPKCNAAPPFSEKVAHMLDCRLSATLCQQLDEFSREDWKQTIQVQFETIQQLAQAKSLRKHPRTPEEEELAKSQHQFFLDQ